jgi:hypothetical protein
MRNLATKTKNNKNVNQKTLPPDNHPLVFSKAEESTITHRLYSLKLRDKTNKPPVFSKWLRCERMKKRGLVRVNLPKEGKNRA